MGKGQGAGTPKVCKWEVHQHMGWRFMEEHLKMRLGKLLILGPILSLWGTLVTDGTARHDTTQHNTSEQGIFPLLYIPSLVAWMY